MARSRQNRGRSEGFNEEALRDVLAIEQQVQNTIADAEHEAEQIVRSAQEKAEELKAEARREAERDAGQRLQEGIAEAEAEADAIRDQAQKEIGAWAQEAEGRLAGAVALVVDIVTGKSRGNGYGA